MISKRAERFAKMAICKDGDGISACEPKRYLDRFAANVIDVVAYHDESTDHLGTLN